MSLSIVPLGGRFVAVKLGAHEVVAGTLYRLTVGCLVACVAVIVPGGR